MKFHLSFSTVASMAVLCGLCGCGGSSGFGGDRAVLVVGGAEGPVFDHLKKSQRLSHVGVGADLGTADTIILDGDHISPGMLGSLRGLRAAAQSGTPVILLDASADLAASVAGEIGCAGAPGDASLAVGFAKIASDNESDYQVFEIRGGNLGVETSSTSRIGDGPVVEGETTTGEVPRVSSETQVRQMLEVLNSGNPPGVETIVLPPKEVKHFLTTYTYSEGNIRNRELNDQVDSALVTHRFLGYLTLGNSEDKPYLQRLLQVSEGRSKVGDLAFEGKDFGASREVYAWTQSWVELSTTIEQNSSLGERFHVTTFSGLRNPGEGASVSNDYAATYKDASGHVRQWQSMMRRDDLGLSQWQVTGGEDPDGRGTRFGYTQTDPYDGLGGDYSG
ncbi:hypothetical protein EON79_17895, partial [bacterium]